MGRFTTMGIELKTPHQLKSSFDTVIFRLFVMDTSFYEHLVDQGMTPHQKLEFFSDGADNLRSLQRYLNAESKHILDWFHITMRITVLHQYAMGLLKVDKKNGEKLQQLLKSIKLNLWHGKTAPALNKINEIYDICYIHQEDNTPGKQYKKVKALETYGDEMYTYIHNNQNFIINYAERHRYGEVISTSFIESTVNYVLSKRFSKKQSMQWTKKGSHLLLQARVKVLNGDWENEFRKIWPKFRPVKLANQPEELKAVA